MGFLFRQSTGLFSIIFVCSISLFAQRSTMYVDGRFLYDKCGENVILRGPNVMTLYWDGYGGENGDWSKQGDYTFSQVTKTGANCSRIFWNTVHGSEGWKIPARALDAVLSNCLKYNMIPMPSVWNATGKGLDEVVKSVDYWLSSDILEVLKKHETHLLLNIANEANVGESNFVNGYGAQIKRLRDAGLKCPLVIDGPEVWAQKEDAMLDNAQALLAKDPLKNIVFSWHLYHSSTCGNDPGTKARIKAAVDKSLEKNVCMVLGEFSRVSGHPGCENAPVEWEYIIDYFQQKSLGWLVWTWWCCGNSADHHSLTYDKMYGHWHNAPFGEQLSITSPNSIKNTSKRTKLMTTGACECTGNDCPQEPDPDPVSLVYNGEFENDLQGWNAWGEQTGITTEASEVKEESKAMKIADGAAAGAGQTVVLEAGKTYTFTAWGMHAATAEKSTDIGVKYKLPDDSEHHEMVHITETSYTKKQITFTMPAEFTGGMVFIWKADANAVAFIDGIILEEALAVQQSFKLHHPVFNAPASLTRKAYDIRGRHINTRSRSGAGIVIMRTEQAGSRQLLQLKTQK